MVAAIINQNKFTEILDYGAGKCRLGEALSDKITHAIALTNYDPAIPDIAESPDPSEFVACIDVLEHIEPDYLDNVLSDLQRVTEVAGFFTISCRKARRILGDGRNAHLIVETPEWWLVKLREKFDIPNFSYSNGTLSVLVKAQEPSIQE